MLKLKTLKFKNISRFVDEQTIDFSNLSGLVQIDALNKNTNGSSGAGKTSILNALEYLLGLNSIPSSILQSRLTKEGISVEGQFDYDGVPLTIVRSKKGLSIDLNGILTEGSSKLAEEKLDQILGMSRELFQVLMVKRQGSPGFFLNFTPKQCHEFLVDAKGLNEYTKKAEQIDLDLKKLLDSEVLAKSKLESVQSALKSTSEALLSVGEPPKPSNFTQESILALKSDHETHEGFLRSVEQSHAKEKDELAKTKPNISVDPFDRTRIIGIESELSGFSGLIKELETKEKLRQTAIKDQVNALKIKLHTAKTYVSLGEKAKVEATKIVTELKSIKQNICPTCERPEWITDNIKAKETELLQKFENAKQVIMAGMESTKEVADLEERIELASIGIAPQPILELIEINKRITELNYEMSDLRKKESEHSIVQNKIVKEANDNYLMKAQLLSQKHTSEMSLAKDRYFQSKQELSNALQDFESALISAKRHQTTLDTLNSQKQLKEKEVIEADNYLKELKEKIEIVQEAKSLVKSFISCSFDETLETIGDKATEIIRNIPNLNTATIQLNGVKETAKGTVKEEVTPTLSANGEESIPIKSLSGGEKSSADMAIDLAVRIFLEESTNCGIDVIGIDEGLTGLDTISMERVLEVLQTLNSQKKILIIDHNDTVKQFCQNKILVTRDGDYSTVEVL